MLLPADNGCRRVNRLSDEYVYSNSFEALRELAREGLDELNIWESNT